MTGIKDASVEDIMLYSDYDKIARVFVVIIMVVVFIRLLVCMF